VGISWATSESLLLRPSCYTLLATHMIELCQLSHLYPSASNCHLEVDMTPGTGRSLRFLFELVEGQIDPVATRGYGVAIAAMSRFPADAIAEARQLSERMLLFLQQQRDALHMRTPPATAAQPHLCAEQLQSTLVPPLTPPPRALPDELLKRNLLAGCYRLADDDIEPEQVLPSALAAYKDFKRSFRTHYGSESAGNSNSSSTEQPNSSSSSGQQQQRHSEAWSAEGRHVNSSSSSPSNEHRRHTSSSSSNERNAASSGGADADISEGNSQDDSELSLHSPRNEMDEFSS